MDDVFARFKELPNDIKRVILRKFQLLVREDNKRQVRCIQWIRLGSPELPLLSAMFECDGVKCLITDRTIECGVTKERGFGLQYGLTIARTDQLTFDTISPTSKAFTNEELKRILRALCNILSYVARITRPQDDIRDMIQAFAKQTVHKIGQQTKQRAALCGIAPRYHVPMRDLPALSADMRKIARSLLAPKRVMMWD